MTDKTTLWGIHMRLQHGMAAVEESFIAIGWDEVGDLSKLAKDRDAFKLAVATSFPQAKQGAIPVWAGVLYRFAVEMKPGDLIVYPSKADRMVNLGEVESDYIYDPVSNADVPNRRKIKWLSHLPRAHFSQEALHEIGSALTLFQINNNAEEFLAAFAGESFEAQDVDQESADAVSSQVEETTEDFIVKRLKSSLDPYQFEQFVAHLLACMGYHAKVTQKTADGGIDIIAHKDELGFEPPIIKVQCKQTLNTVGEPEVAQLYGHVEPSEFGLFVTLGGYSSQARQFERGKSNLNLIDGDKLISLVFEHYHQFEPRYQVLLPLKRVYVPSAVAREGAGD